MANKDPIQTIRRISQKLLETWQELDPVEALDKTLSDILRQVDEEVISDQEISAVVYTYEEGEGFYGGVACGPLHDYMTQYPPRKGGTAEYVVRTKEPLFINDISDVTPGIPASSQLAIEQNVKASANLPLLIGEAGQETVVGILIINLREKYDFDENRQVMLCLFADQAAIALQNARVHRRRLREQQALQAISESAIGGGPDGVEDIIARQAGELTKSTYVTLWSAGLGQTQLELKGTYNTDPQWQPHKSRLPVDEHSINGHVARTKTAYYASKLDTDPHYARWHERIKAALCVPLLVRGELIGTLYVASEKESGIAPADRDFVKRLAPHAAIALHNARLLEQEHNLRKRAEALQTIAAELRMTLDLETVGDIILEQLKKIVPYRTASLQRIRAKDQRELFAANGFDIKKADSFFTRSLSKDPLVAEITSSGLPKILPDVSQYKKEYLSIGVGKYAPQGSKKFNTNKAF